MKKPTPIKILLSYIDLAYPSTISPEELVGNDRLLNSVIRIAEKNGLYYSFISKLKEHGLVLNNQQEHRWNEEKQRLLELKKTIALLDEVATNGDIEYVIIKACNSIPHVPRDIDIFVRKEDRMKMIEALENKGMNCVQLGIAETSLKGEYMKVDIYTEICYIGVNFIDDEFLLQSSFKDEFFGVKYSGLNNEANLLLLLVHSLFGHRSISLLDFVHIKHIRESTDVDKCKRYALKMGWEPVFDLVLNDIDVIQKRFYSGLDIPFPHLFGRGFVWNCIYGIRGLNLDLQNRIFFHITLVQDRIIYELKDTPIYDLIKSYEPTRNLINSLTAFIKSKRGDKKSIN